jgi:hypothetical protein
LSVRGIIGSQTADWAVLHWWRSILRCQANDNFKNFCQIFVASLIVLHPAVEKRDAISQRKEKKTERYRNTPCLPEL